MGVMYDSRRYVHSGGDDESESDRRTYGIIRESGCGGCGQPDRRGAGIRGGPALGRATLSLGFTQLRGVCIHNTITLTPALSLEGEGVSARERGSVEGEGGC